MNKELDEKLVKDFPKIFRDRHGDKMKTAMCWGFDCGDGWYALIHTLCTNIQAHINANKKTVPQVVAVQVKEKFGGLRFYIGSGDETIHKLINDAEEQSYNTCEFCGSTTNVKQTSGWITSLCEEHFPKS